MYKLFSKLLLPWFFIQTKKGLYYGVSTSPSHNRQAGTKEKMTEHKEKRLASDEHWLSKFYQIISPSYEHVDKVNGFEIAQTFEEFSSNLLHEKLGNEEEYNPKSPYPFNIHIGAYVKSMGEAKDHFLNALLAYHAERGSYKEEEK
jgi:hypothetical protein